MITPEWIELRAVIMSTLKPYPDIQAELVQRLVRIEGSGGDG
jgi:hypothetical protein